MAHSAQNLAPAPFVVPQFGQTTPNGVAHSVQNFAPGLFSVPQLEQITAGAYRLSASGRGSGGALASARDRRDPASGARGPAPGHSLASAPPQVSIDLHRRHRPGEHVALAESATEQVWCGLATR